MKKICPGLFAILFSPLLQAQELTGLWMGTLTNDSTKKEQRYELALSEYRGRVTGYSYTTFIRNDTLYFSIKRMKATRHDSIWIVEDDDMLLHNFPERPAKGVRQINTFRLNKSDSTWQLDGNWKTTQTKRYYSLSGTMKMGVEENLEKSSLIAHLEELNLQNTVAFYQQKKQHQYQQKKEPLVKNNQHVTRDRSGNNTIAAIDHKEQESPVGQEESKPAIAIAKNDEVKQGPTTATGTSAKPGNTQEDETVRVIQEKPAPSTLKKEDDKNNPGAENGQPASKAVIAGQPVNNEENEIIESKTGYIVQTTRKKPGPPANVQKKEEVMTDDTKKNVLTRESKTTEEIQVEKVEKTDTKPAKAAVQNTSEDPKILPVTVTARKTETIEQFFFRTDSLVLSLYDNGVVDGDTVTVFLNGVNILDRQKLKGVATKKTIYIPPHADSLELVLFADNLGSIPPNTGLLTIRDGEEVFQVRFSADMQKNAAIVLRRRR